MTATRYSIRQVAQLKNGTTRLMRNTNLTCVYLVKG